MRIDPDLDQILENIGHRLLDNNNGSKPAEEHPRLGSVSRAEALKRIANTPMEWIVKGMLERGGYGSLSGPKGVGKTFSLADLSVSAGLGEPWFGRFETARTKVLFCTGEDSEARTWARLDAICRSKGRDPEELEGWVHVHPIPFSAINNLDLLKGELDAVGPGLTALDPAYKYLAGAKSSNIYAMGEVLTPVQTACQERDSALLFGHHFNRNTKAEREEQISGAGILEWSRTVATVKAPPRRGSDDPEAGVLLTFEITGNSIDPVSFSLRRHVTALDDSPNPELNYRVEVVAEGQDVKAKAYMSAADRIMAVLPTSQPEALLVKEIGDLVANDSTGKGGLKHETIRTTLNDKLKGRVDSESRPEGSLWWAV